MHTYVHTYIYIVCRLGGHGGHVTSCSWVNGPLFMTGAQDGKVPLSLSLSLSLFLCLCLCLCPSVSLLYLCQCLRKKKNYQNIFFLSPGSCVGCEGGREERARTRGFRARAPQWKRCCGGYCCDWRSRWCGPYVCPYMCPCMCCMSFCMYP
jgi:hypothetical protein